jgi:hypothetical protein
MRVVLLSYANAVFERALRAIAAEAAAFPFDEVRTVREADLELTSFWAAHGEFVRVNRRGGGFWLWKSWLVAQALEGLQDGDVLVYADAGCALDAAKLGRFAEYLRLVAAHPSGVLAFEMPHPQRRWTKAAAMAALAARGPVDGAAGQVAATAFFVRAGPATRALAAEWHRLCCAHGYHLLDDAPSKVTADAAGTGAPPPDAPALAEASDFHEHRHDQAIWSLLVRQHGALLIPDEMWPPGGQETGPIVATRRR